MSSKVATQFPAFKDELNKLVEEHLKLKDEPLLLAIYYVPERDPEDVFLFEVISKFGAGSVDPDQELFEVSYGDKTGFPLEPGQHLHLVLTNPEELKVAVNDNWSLAAEIRQAFKNGKAQVLFEHDDGKRLLEMIRV